MGLLQKGKRMFNRKDKFTKEERHLAQEKRQLIMREAEAMKRLINSPDFKIFTDMITKDKENLNKTLLNENITVGDRLANDAIRIRLIARINQIDSMLAIPRRSLWRLKNMTEMRDIIKTHERQALVK